MRSPIQTPSASLKTPSSVYPDFVDPAVYWALGPGIDYFFLPWRQNKEWLPIVIQLRGITPERFVEVEIADDRDKFVLSDFIQFSKLGPATHSLPIDDDYHMASANKSLFFNILANPSFHDPLAKQIASITLGLPLDSISLPPSQGGPRR